MRRPWTEEDDQKLRSLREQNLSLHVIATRLERPETSTAQRWHKLTKRQDVQARRASNGTVRFWNNSELRQLRDMLDQKFPAPAIARALGRPLSSTHYKIHSVTNTGAKVGPWTEQEHQQFLALRRQGQSNSAIATALNRSLDGIVSRNLRYSSNAASDPFTDRYWNESEDATLIKLRDEGKALPEIAAAMSKRSPIAVRNRLKALKSGKVLPRGRPYRRWTSVEVDRLRDMYAEGLSTTEIAAKLDRSVAMVGQMRRSLQSPAERQKNSSKRWTSDERNMLLELRRQGLSFAHIASKLPGRTTEACKTAYKVFVRRPG